MNQLGLSHISRNRVVTLDYSVTDSDGNLLDEGRELISYLHGGYNDIFPRIEAALEGQEVRDTVVVKLQPDEAFGEYDAGLIQIESRHTFPDGLEVGMHVESKFEQTFEEEEEEEETYTRIFRVTDIAGDSVVLDANHPLAGVSLIFTATVTAIRPASESEIRQGYMHQFISSGYGGQFTRH